MSINPETKFFTFKKFKILQIKNDLEIYLNSSDFESFQGFTVPSIIKHIDTLSELMYFYLYDKRPFSVGFSGGKDSSVTVDFIIKAVMLVKNIYGANFATKTTYVMFSDTLLEMDPIISGINSAIESMRAFTIEYGLNFDVREVSPEVKLRFYSNLIGKGTTLPTSGGKKRWCTDKMKILPQKKEILKILNTSKDGFIAVTGQRQEEGINRAKNMQRHTVDGSLKSHDYKNCSLYAPVEHFTSEDIWAYLYGNAMEWVDVNELGKVYAEASEGDGDECRSLLIGSAGTTPGCGKSGRFGCYVCGIIESKDKALNNLTKHYSYMHKMEEFRNWIVVENRKPWQIHRDIYMHGKHKKNIYNLNNHKKGMNIPGGYTLAFRKEILTKLIELEREVRPNRLKQNLGDGYLISSEELAYIQECWFDDGDMEISVKQIAYDRDFEISDKYQRAYESVKMVREKLVHTHNYFQEAWKPVIGLHLHSNQNRYWCQLAIQMEKRYMDSYKYLTTLVDENYPLSRELVLEQIKELPIKDMYFFDKSEEDHKVQEWIDDRIGFDTFLDTREENNLKRGKLNLLDFSRNKDDAYEYGQQGENKINYDKLDALNEARDIINVDNNIISLEEKMRYFDTF